MTTSAYPAAVDRVLAIFHAAFDSNTGDATTYIVEGPGASNTTAKRLIFVGMEAVESVGGNSGTGNVVWGPMGNHARDERFSIPCVLKAWAGNQDPLTRRTETFALFDAITSALTTDPSISRPGGVLYLETYTWSYDSIADPKGTAGLIQFALNFRARI